MIKQMYSRRHKRKMWRLDAKEHGKRFRKFFFKRSDAEAVAYKLAHDETVKRYGLPTSTDRPFLSELTEKRVEVITNKREQTRARRVLTGLLSVCPEGLCVDEIAKADIQLYVNKRKREGLKPQSIDRELNIISAMLNKVDTLYPQLAQWRPPRMPRPKVTGGRRERVWRDHEIKGILGELFAPRREGEQGKAAFARARVGWRVQFCLLSGLRHSEMNLIAKGDVDWKAKTVRIRQGKTGNYKTIGPLGPTAMHILKMFADQSETSLVFSRSGNITPRFYGILREACQRAGVLYGKNTPGGLVLHDARHTATTQMLESGVSPATAREWMGWSESKFVLYYSHASQKQREKAGRSLERLAGKKSA
jgi:integrase